MRARHSERGATKPREQSRELASSRTEWGRLTRGSDFRNLGLLSPADGFRHRSGGPGPVTSAANVSLGLHCTIGWYTCCCSNHAHALARHTGCRRLSGERSARRGLRPRAVIVKWRIDCRQWRHSSATSCSNDRWRPTARSSRPSRRARRRWRWSTPCAPTPTSSTPSPTTSATRYGAPVTPSDPLFAKQWALPMINAPAGVGRRLPRLAGGHRRHHRHRLRRAPRDRRPHRPAATTSSPTPANAADGDGRDGDPTDTGDSTDSSSALHGTHVAGIIAAERQQRRRRRRRRLGLPPRHRARARRQPRHRRRQRHLRRHPLGGGPARRRRARQPAPGRRHQHELRRRRLLAVDAGRDPRRGRRRRDRGRRRGQPRQSTPRATRRPGSTASSPSARSTRRGSIASYSNYGGVVALMAPGGSPRARPETAADGRAVDDRAGRLRLHLHLLCRHLAGGAVRRGRGVADARGPSAHERRRGQARCCRRPPIRRRKCANPTDPTTARLRRGPARRRRRRSAQAARPTTARRRAARQRRARRLRLRARRAGRPSRAGAG